jgi:hypothetical protein
VVREEERGWANVMRLMGDLNSALSPKIAFGITARRPDSKIKICVIL